MKNTNIAVYKKGGTTNIWGHMFDMKVVPDQKIESMVADGWVTDPKDLIDDEKDVSFLEQSTKKTRRRRT